MKKEDMRLTNDDLDRLIKKYDWFLDGTPKQLSKLHTLVALGGSLEEIATAIWMCTGRIKTTSKDILAELNTFVIKKLWDMNSDAE